MTKLNDLHDNPGARKSRVRVGRGIGSGLGKTAGRDAALAKSTYVSLLGVEAARSEAIRYHDEAVSALQPLGAAAQPLLSLARYIVTRPS